MNLRTYLIKNYIANSLNNYSRIFLHMIFFLWLTLWNAHEAFVPFFRFSLSVIISFPWWLDLKSTFLHCLVSPSEFQSKTVQEEHSFNIHWRKMHLLWTELYCALCPQHSQFEALMLQWWYLEMGPLESD